MAAIVKPKQVEGIGVVSRRINTVCLCQDCEPAISSSSPPKLQVVEYGLFLRLNECRALDPVLGR